MERTPEKQHEQHEHASINLLSDPEGAIKAMARIEGPDWLNEQERIAELVLDGGITDPAQIEHVANSTITGAIEKLKRLTERQREKPRPVYAIRGYVHSYLVYPDGRIHFVIFQAGADDSEKRQELLKTVLELGFEIAP